MQRVSEVDGVVHEKGRWVNVLVTLAGSILSYLRPSDALDLLQCCRTLLYNDCCWFILYHQLHLNDPTVQEAICKLGWTMKSHRDIVTHTIRRLGFNCSTCYQPLYGPCGFFVCTSMCSSCSRKHLLASKAPYVEATIK